MQSMEAHTETTFVCCRHIRKMFYPKNCGNLSEVFHSVRNAVDDLSECLQKYENSSGMLPQGVKPVCVYVCAWYNDQPGLKVYMCNHTIIRKTSGWTLDGLCRYKCTGDCVRVNVFNHRSAFGYTTMTFNIYYYWKIHYQLLSLQCKTHATVLETHRLTSPLPYRPVQTPSLRHQTCLSISDYKPSNSSLCLNDRPFICVSALSSYMTLMALTSCKPQQLAVWVHECV